MTAPPASVRHLRDAAASEVERTSLRSVAREIGISATGLKKFLEGTNPYSPTLRRLRRWDGERAATGKGLPPVDAELFAICLNILVHDLAPEAAAVAREQAYACLDAAFGVMIPRVVVPQQRRTIQIPECGAARLTLPPSARAAPVSWTILRPPTTHLDSPGSLG